MRFIKSLMNKYKITSIQVKNLRTALKYRYGHICKSDPSQLKEFYLESSETFVEHFRGMIEIEMNIVKKVPCWQWAGQVSYLKYNQYTNAFVQ